MAADPPEADTCAQMVTDMPEADTVLRCEGSVTMVAEAGERAKGEVAGGGAPDE